MKEFDKPRVSITQEEYDQLQECKSLVNMLWMRFGPYKWPTEFNLPRGKTLRTFHEKSDDFKFYSEFRSRIDRLMGFDDSE